MSEHPTPQPPINPDQGELFDATPLTPEQEHLARVDAAFSAADPNVVGDQPIELSTPLSREEEIAHKDALEYLQITEPKGDLLPEQLKLQRDWSDTLQQHERKQAEHVAAATKNLEARLAANDTAHQQHTRRTEADAHNYAINARDSETAERKTAKEAFVADQMAAAKAERSQRATARRAFVNREKLLRGEAQAKLFSKEIREAADQHVEELLGPEQYGKLTPELQARLEAAADRHVEDTLGPGQHTGYGVLDTENLKDDADKPTPSQLENQKTSEALKDFQRGFADSEDDDKGESQSDADKEDDGTTDQASTEQTASDREFEARMQAQQERLTILTAKAHKARMEYAHLNAERGRRIRRIGKGKAFSREAIITARKKYEASRDTLIRFEKGLALEAGVNLTDLDTYSEAFAIGDAERMLEELHDQRLLATGDYVRTTELVTGGDGIQREHINVDEVPAKTPFGRALRGFYKWWGSEQTNKLLSFKTLKKSTVMAAAGAAVGVPAALAGSVVLGPLAGGALGAVVAGKIARGVMANHLSRRSRGKLHIDQLHDDLSGYIHGSGYNANGVGRVIEAQTANEMYSNRRRVLASAVIAAAGGFGGQLFAHDVLGLGAGHGGHAHGATKSGHTVHHQSHAHHNVHQNHGGQHGGVEATLNHRGDSIWEEVARHGHNPSEANVASVTDEVLKAQHLTFDQARDLPVGYHFELTPDMLERLNS
jgi:hypothetical protein